MTTQDTISKIQALVNILFLAASVEGVNVTQIEKYFDDALDLWKVEVGLLPASSLANDVTDIDSLATALVSAGLLPATLNVFVNKYINEFASFVSEYKAGQVIALGAVTIDSVPGHAFILADSSTTNVAVDLGTATETPVSPAEPIN